MDEIIIDTNRPGASCPSFQSTNDSYMPAEALQMAKKHAKFAENFDTLHPDGEKSQIFSILTA